MDVKREMTKWDKHFLLLAETSSLKSKDPSTKVGAVIVGPDNEIRSTGYNDFPRGVEDKTVPDRWERPHKYHFVVHAEANCIFNAARHGASLKGCHLYLNWEPYPCPECTKAIINSGIISVIGPNIEFPSKNYQELINAYSRPMLKEAGVSTGTVDIGSMDLKSVGDNL